MGALKLNVNYYKNTRLASILLNHYHTFFDEDERTNKQVRKLKLSSSDHLRFIEECLEANQLEATNEGSRSLYAYHAPLHSSWLQSMQWLRRQLVETSTNSDLPTQNLLFKYSLLVHNTFDESLNNMSDE